MYFWNSIAYDNEIWNVVKVVTKQKIFIIIIIGEGKFLTLNPLLKGWPTLTQHNKAQIKKVISLSKSTGLPLAGSW